MWRLHVHCGKVLDWQPCRLCSVECLMSRVPAPCSHVCGCRRAAGFAVYLLVWSSLRLSPLWPLHKPICLHMRACTVPLPLTWHIPYPVYVRLCLMGGSGGVACRLSLANAMSPPFATCCEHWTVEKPLLLSQFVGSSWKRGQFVRDAWPCACACAWVVWHGSP